MIVQALKFIDPIGAFLAGLLTLRLAIAIILRDFQVAIAPETVFTVWGIVLVGSSLLTPISLLLRGFETSRSVGKALQSNSLSFWLGVLLLFAAHATVLIQRIESSVPYLGIIDSVALCIGTGFAFVIGAESAAQRLGKLARSLALATSIACANRRRGRALIGELTLCAGEATGVFGGRGVVGAPNRGELLLYGGHSPQRGTMLIGSPGSGKTRTKIYSDLHWALLSSPRAGALVFTSKKHATGDCYAIAAALRPKSNIHIVGVGPGREHLNIMSGMTTEAIADAIQDGLGTSNSDFWIQAPSGFAEAPILLMRALAPTRIHVPADLDENGNVKPGGDASDLEISETIPTLLKLLVPDPRRLNAVFKHGFARVQELSKTDTRKASALADLLDRVRDRLLPLMHHDARLWEELRQSLLPQLQPFEEPVVRDAFCDAHGIDLGLVEQGHVIIVEIDEANYPRAVPPVSRFVFRRAVQMARERTAPDRIGLLDPVAIIADEYQNFAASGHRHAWNTIRESVFCATVSITSVSALAKQLGGDAHGANAMIANFGNKFFFRTDDEATRALARELAGKAIMRRHSQSSGASRSRGSSSSGHPSGGGSHHSTSTSETTSTNEQLEYVIDGSLWSNLMATRDSATAIAFVDAAAGTAADVVSLGVLNPREGITTALPEAYGFRLPEPP